MIPTTYNHNGILQGICGMSENPQEGSWVGTLLHKITVLMRDWRIVWCAAPGGAATFP